MDSSLPAPARGRLDDPVIFLTLPIRSATSAGLVIGAMII